jgi:hypothetical protein
MATPVLEQIRDLLTGSRLAEKHIQEILLELADRRTAGARQHRRRRTCHGTIVDLPPDVLLQVWAHLAPIDRLALRCTSGTAMDVLPAVPPGELAERRFFYCMRALDSTEPLGVADAVSQMQLRSHGLHIHQRSIGRVYKYQRASVLLRGVYDERASVHLRGTVDVIVDGPAQERSGRLRRSTISIMLTVPSYNLAGYAKFLEKGAADYDPAAFAHAIFSRPHGRKQVVWTLNVPVHTMGGAADTSHVLAVAERVWRENPGVFGKVPVLVEFHNAPLAYSVMQDTIQDMMDRGFLYGVSPYHR